MVDTEKYEHPWEWDFPPFFTIQPNHETRKIQLEAWRGLILAYCRKHNITRLQLRDWYKREPFHNDSINRKLNLNSMRTIMDSLVEKKCGEWLEDKEVCLVYTTTPEQWADIIYDYVRKNGMQNTMFTFYELLEGDTYKDAQFHNLDEEVFRRSIMVLERSGRAASMEMEGSYGVKFR